jgi:Fe-S-cluster-containing hydrogenase component 2
MLELSFLPRRCIGCGECELACGRLHGDIARLTVSRAGEGYWLWMCRRCERPLCVEACPARAVTDSPSGPVYDETRCVSCHMCIVACPNGGIIPGIQGGHKVLRCDCVLDAPPACQEACPTGALKAGPSYVKGRPAAWKVDGIWRCSMSDSARRA